MMLGRYRAWAARLHGGQLVLVLLAGLTLGVLGCVSAVSAGALARSSASTSRHTVLLADSVAGRFDREGARAAGYSERDIDAFLQGRIAAIAEAESVALAADLPRAGILRRVLWGGLSAMAAAIAVASLLLPWLAVWYWLGARAARPD